MLDATSGAQVMSLRAPNSGNIVSHQNGYVTGSTSDAAFIAQEDYGSRFIGRMEFAGNNFLSSEIVQDDGTYSMRIQGMYVIDIITV